jgi:hypothetical protein
MNGVRVLGMIGCLVLGDEMAHVLESDPALENVLIVDNREGRVFMEKLCPDTTGQRVQLVNIAELRTMQLSAPTVIVWVKESTLHDQPQQMLDNMASSIGRLEPFCGSILLFFGLCRNTKYEIKRFADSFDVPVTFLTDAHGEVVDDCFAAVLGGREQYMDMIRANKYAMLLTPGYAESWAMKQEGKDLEAMVEQFENYQLLFRTLGYNKVVMLDNGLGDQESFKERAKVFASMFDLSIETAPCNVAIFERSYRLAWSRLSMAPSAAREVGESIILSRTLP